MPVSADAVLRSSRPFARLIHTSGEVVDVWNVAEFSAQRGLIPQGVYAVVQRHRPHHKGWSLEGGTYSTKKRNELFHTDGREAVFDNAAEWAEVNGLSPKEVRKVIRGERRSLAGWSLVKGDTGVKNEQRTLYHIGGLVASFTDTPGWCTTKKLSKVAIYEVLRGARKSYKGWALKANVKEHIWCVTSPLGTTHRFQSIRKFALDNDLDPANLRRVLLGLANSHRGWRADATLPIWGGNKDEG